MAPLRCKPQGMWIGKPAWFAWRVFLRWVVWGVRSVPRCFGAEDAARKTVGCLGLKVSLVLL